MSSTPGPSPTAVEVFGCVRIDRQDGQSIDNENVFRNRGESLWSDVGDIDTDGGIRVFANAEAGFPREDLPAWFWLRLQPVFQEEGQLGARTRMPPTASRHGFLP